MRLKKPDIYKKIRIKPMSDTKTLTVKKNG